MNHCSRTNIGDIEVHVAPWLLTLNYPPNNFFFLGFNQTTNQLPPTQGLVTTESHLVFLLCPEKNILLTKVPEKKKKDKRTTYGTEVSIRKSNESFELQSWLVGGNFLTFRTLRKFYMISECVKWKEDCVSLGVAWKSCAAVLFDIFDTNESL